MKHKKHNSHYIFALLGVLILLFLVVFGTRYFQGQYSFEPVAVAGPQAYDDGVSIENPFSVTASNQINYKPFTGESLDTSVELYDVFTLQYPESYRFFNEAGDLYRITANVDIDNCDSVVHEQERIVCENRNIVSPNIFINKISPENQGFFEANSDSVFVDGLEWKRFIFSSEFGVLDAYRATIDGQEYEISMISADSPKGNTFIFSEFLLLDTADQSKLLRKIVESIEINKNNE